LDHIWIKIDAFGVVGDGLVEVFALDGLVSLCSLGLCPFFSLLLIHGVALVLKILLVIL